jgi:hypothetical protein
MALTKPAGYIGTDDIRADVEDFYADETTTGSKTVTVPWRNYMYVITPSYVVASKWNSKSSFAKKRTEVFLDVTDAVSLGITLSEMYIPVFEDAVVWAAEAVPASGWDEVDPMIPEGGTLMFPFAGNVLYSICLTEIGFGKTNPLQSSQEVFACGVCISDVNFKNKAVAANTEPWITFNNTEGESAVTPGYPISSYLMHDALTHNVNRLVSQAPCSVCIPFFGDHTITARNVDDELILQRGL